MNRDALDEWFAQAEDVLTDWRPGGDAMHATPARADWYREQPPHGAARAWASAWLADPTYTQQQTRYLVALADPEEARRRTVAELERLRSTVMVGPGSGWVVEIRDGVGRWHNLTTSEDDTP